MTADQKERVLAEAPPGMSVHQAAKWLLLKKIDKKVANEMADRVADGYKRLTT